jgi:uncharacterized protein YegP (UPF0339 family)
VLALPMAKFIIRKRVNGEFMFNLKAGNGLTILTSEGYAAMAGCQNGIESVRKHAVDKYRYDKLISANSKYYFNLKAANGEIIGTSEMYESSSGRDTAIESVGSNAPVASVEDHS